MPASHRRPLRAIRRRLAGEGGFSLMEAVVGILIVGLMILGLTYTLGGSLSSVRETKRYQQATALGTAAIESGRDLAFDTLVMRTSDLTGDAAISNPATNPKYDPDGGGALVAEPVIHNASCNPCINPHTTTETVDGEPYTVRRYASWVDDAIQGGTAQSYKRLTAVVSWSAPTGAKSYRTSTFITKARRGVPRPKFEIAPVSQGKTVKQGNQVTFAHTVTNNGVIDAYDLSLPVPGGRGWTIRAYQDVDQDGSYDPAVETDAAALLTDTNANGTVDTGNVASGTTFHLLFTWTLAVGETLGTVTLNGTATSGAVPLEVRSFTETLTVGTPTPLTLYLHNQPTPPVANTNAVKNLTMNTSAPAATTNPPYRYSSSSYAKPGRWVDRIAPDPVQASTLYMANWLHQSTRRVFSGAPTLRIWVAKRDTLCSSPAVSFTVYLRDRADTSSDAGTLIQTATATSQPATFSSNTNCNFRVANVTLPTTDYTIANNRYLELKIVVNSSTNNAAVFAYDTTTYGAYLTMPLASS